jgi:hypothetical protein
MFVFIHCVYARVLVRMAFQIKSSCRSAVGLELVPAIWIRWRQRTYIPRCEYDQ